MEEEKEFKDKVTYCLTGSPRPFWSIKENFKYDMKKWGFEYTSLTKNTDMLIASDKDIGTLKWKKAEKYGIPIYTYSEAFDRKEKLYLRITRKNKVKDLMNKLGE